MNAIQSNVVSITARLCREFMAQTGAISQLDVLNEAFKDEMTTQNLQTIPALAAMELTSEELQSAIYVLKTVNTALLTGNLVAVTKMANL